MERPSYCARTASVESESRLDEYILVNNSFTAIGDEYSVFDPSFVAFINKFGGYSTIVHALDNWDFNHFKRIELKNINSSNCRGVDNEAFTTQCTTCIRSVVASFRF